MRKYYHHRISSTLEPTLRASLPLQNNERHSIALPAGALVMNRLLEKKKKCESGGFLNTPIHSL